MEAGSKLRRVRRGARRTVAAIALAVTSVAVLASAAHAAPPAGARAVVAPYDFAHSTVPPTAAQVKAGIDDVLRRTPGARQVGPTTIDMGGGFIVELPKPAGTVQPLYTCSSGYMCVWVDRQYTGTYAYFQVCGHEWDLGHSAFPGGGYWNDRISSITNPQTGSNATGYFYNYNTNGTWSKLLTVPINTHRSNLALDSSEDGSGSPNDRIDGVHVCGAVPSPWKPNYSSPLPPS
ncbi:peptidase inhibitor family I36 protein [Actinoallomurus acaciae]|uniref:Peptidase inhibitor family I36 protein n=1 Tax=Actinoallomurus acaciae TaxID=502577 RepID=A0ABV5YB06_9ACTN